MNAVFHSVGKLVITRW